VGGAGIPIYPGGGRLCLSGCPPLRIISGTALSNSSYKKHNIISK